MDQDERVMAYVDGELDPPARAAFEQELAENPALQAEVTRHRRLRTRFAAAFDPVLDEPVPLGLALAVQSANSPRRAWRAPQRAAMAACLLVGVVIGRAVLPLSGSWAEHDGAMIARGALGKALETQLAAEAGPIRIGLTFRNAQGRWCRTFESTPDRLAGLACREPQGWTAHALAAWTPPASQAGYRTAGTETPAPVLAAVDQAIAGLPADAQAERAARDNGWSS
jgi:hypothetical protein